MCMVLDFKLLYEDDLATSPANQGQRASSTSDPGRTATGLNNPTRQINNDTCQLEKMDSCEKTREQAVGLRRKGEDEQHTV